MGYHGSRLSSKTKETVLYISIITLRRIRLARINARLAAAIPYRRVPKDQALEVQPRIWCSLRHHQLYFQEKPVVERLTAQAMPRSPILSPAYALPFRSNYSFFFVFLFFMRLISRRRQEYRNSSFHSSFLISSHYTSSSTIPYPTNPWYLDVLPLSTPRPQ